MHLRPLAVTLSLTLAMVGCIHTSPSDSAAVEAKSPPSALTTMRQGDLGVSYVIYQPSLLPLEEFFTHLTAGDYDQALRHVRLSYQPATSDNDALRRLLAEGFVPVYVQLENLGSQSLHIATPGISLSDGRLDLAAIPAGDLPNELQRFNVAALSANIYNTTIVVVGVVAIFAAVALAGGSGLNFPSVAKSDVINPTATTTTILYHDYLLDQPTLQPGAKTAGLVFFRSPTPPLWDALQLAVRPAALPSS